jgi:CHAD domain-containing protein
MITVPISDPALTRLAARAMLTRLDAMAARIDGVRTADDVEDVHRMRVASRRLRAALARFHSEFPGPSLRKWTRTVRRVTKGLGEARDLDVQILFLREHLANLDDPAAGPGVAALLAHLERRRAKRQRRAVRAMDTLEASGLLEDLGGTLRRILGDGDGAPERSVAVYARAYDSIRAASGRVLAYDPVVRDPARVEEHHEMRIAAKRLRYAMELFAPAYDGALDRSIRAVKRLQTLLGDLHDCDVWLELLPRFLDRERNRTRHPGDPGDRVDALSHGIDDLVRDRTERRRELHATFVETWERLGRDDAWAVLVDTLAGPLTPSTGGPG